MSYTKGEWKIEQSRGGWDDDVSIIGGDGAFVAQIKWINDNQEANARLISAAPDQHEALLATQYLLERLGLECSDEYSRNAAAISKALGK